MATTIKLKGTPEAFKLLHQKYCEEDIDFMMDSLTDEDDQIILEQAEKFVELGINVVVHNKPDEYVKRSSAFAFDAY